MAASNWDPISSYHLYTSTPKVLAKWNDPTASRITITTSNGQWVQKALKINDPIFGDLISDHQVRSGHESVLANDQLVLHDIVGEVLCEQWSAVEKLYSYLNQLHVLSKEHGDQWWDLTPMRKMLINSVARSTPRPATVHYPASTHITTVMSEPSPFGTSLQNVVYLHEINKIVEMVKLPQNWELAVVVDDRSPEVERTSHLRRVGALMEEHKMLPILEEMNNIRRTPAAYLLDLLRWVTTAVSGEEGKETVAGEMKCLVLGHIRNALLLSIASSYSGPGLDWQLVRWRDLYELMKAHGYAYQVVDRKDHYTSPTEAESQQYRSNELYNSLALMSGVLSWTVTGWWGNSLPLTVPHGRDMTSYLNDSKALYHLLLRSLPKDATPRNMGLHLIVEGGEQYEWMSYWDQQKEGPYPPAYALYQNDQRDNAGINIELLEFVQHYTFRTLADDSLNTHYESFDGACGTYAFVAPVMTLEQFKGRLASIHAKLGNLGLQRMIQCLSSELERSDPQPESDNEHNSPPPRDVRRIVEFTAVIADYLKSQGK